MFQSHSLLSSLVSLGERQLANEDKATDILLSELRSLGIEPVLQEFSVDIPVVESAKLLADGQNLPVRATSFVSGKIPSKEIVLSSAIPMAQSPDLPNINVNPYCRALSPGNHYWHPSVAVTPEVLEQIFCAEDVHGEVVIERVSHRTRNILVGNIENPSAIVFSHYDSLGPGANDNASGVAAKFSALKNDLSLLDKHLFVFSGSEELSYEKPYYWGAGYRVFLKDYQVLIASTSKIIVIDSVGVGPIEQVSDSDVLMRAFPLDDHSVYEKSVLIVGSLEKLMKVYHSELDTAKRLEKDALDDATLQLTSLLQP